MKELFNFIVKFAALSLFYISKLIPRKKNIWVFGEANGFNNNSKYLFFDILKSRTDITAIWIGDNDVVKTLSSKGLPAEKRYSIKGLYYCLVAKIYFVSSTPGDINFYTSGGAIVINLWHGVGWKACLWSNPMHYRYDNMNKFQKFAHLINNPHLYFKPDIVLSTSKEMTKKFFSPMFRVDESKCIEAIYPRCQFMLQEKSLIKEHVREFENKANLDLINSLENYEKVIIYAPTFRDSGNDFLVESGIDYSDLNDYCRERNYLFIIKCHPATKFSSVELDGLSNIMYLDRRFDLYLIMPFSDIMISDYSSIALDYLLLDKKVIFYPFDLKQFKAQCRNFCFDYLDSIKEASIVYEYENLKKCIGENESSINPVIKSRFWDANITVMERMKTEHHEWIF